MIFGELAPKNLAIARPARTAIIFVPPVLLLNTLARPLIRFLNAAANWSMQRVGIQPREELPGVESLEELRSTLRWAALEGEIEGVEHALLDLCIGPARQRRARCPCSSFVRRVAGRQRHLRGLDCGFQGHRTLALPHPGCQRLWVHRHRAREGHAAGLRRTIGDGQ